MLLGPATFALFGGSTNFEIFTKIMSRILPMILGPTRILDAFIIRHVVIAQEGATTKMEKKSTKEETEEKTEEKMEEKTEERTEDEEAPANDTPRGKRTTVPGAAIVPLAAHVSFASHALPQSSSTTNTHGGNTSSANESFINISTRKMSQAVRARQSSVRRDYYLLIPRWAVAVYCVPVFLLCVAVFIRLATWPDCAAGSDVCLVRTYPIFRGLEEYAHEGYCACNVILFDQTGIFNGSCAEGTQDATLERQLQATVASASHVYMAVFSVNFQCPHVAETVAKAWDKFDSIHVFIIRESWSIGASGRDQPRHYTPYFISGMTMLRAKMNAMKAWTNLCTRTVFACFFHVDVFPTTFVINKDLLLAAACVLLCLLLPPTSISPCPLTPIVSTLSPCSLSLFRPIHLHADVLRLDFHDNPKPPTNVPWLSDLTLLREFRFNSGLGTLPEAMGRLSVLSKCIATFAT